MIQLLKVAPHADKRLHLDVVLEPLHEEGGAVAPCVADEHGAAHREQLMQLLAIEYNIKQVLVLKSAR